MNKYLTFVMFAFIFTCIFQVSQAQNNALNFDGTDNYVAINSLTTPLSSAGSFTIECWFNGDDITTTESDHFLWGINGAIGNSITNIILCGLRGDKLIVYYNGNDVGIKGTTVIDQGIWYHVSLAKSSDNSFILYLNGEEELTGSLTTAIPDGSRFSIGQEWDNTTPSDFFDGKIDEFRVWNDVRIETEIRQNMYRELPNPSRETNFVAYYKFNETSGTSLADSKGSFTGTLTNMAGNEWQTSPAMFSPKNCLDFDGNNDRAISTNATAVSANSTLTIEAWVQPDVIKESVFAAHGNTYLSIGMTSSGEVVSRTYDAGNGSGQINNSGYILETNSWYHIAAVFYNGASTVYVNGLKVGQTSACTNSSALDGRKYFVGYGYIYNETYFDGQIDEVRIWSTARTASEIRENMMKTLHGDESGLEVYYTFDNTTGDKLQDFSSNGNDGTLQNMANDDWVASSAFNTWLDVNTTTWNTATNWSLGSVPSTTTNVGLYDFGGSNPVIPTGQTVNNLVVGSDVDTEVSAGNNLTVSENLHNLGTFTVASKSMGTSGTGSLIVEGTATGIITFERYADVYAKGQKWHYVSAPVSGQALSTTWMDNNNIGFANPAYQFFRFSEINNYWIYFDYEGSEPEDFGDASFVDARGYCLTRTSDGVLSFSGTPITDNVTYAATYTAGEGAGFNLVGNPFTSAIGVTTAAETTGNFLTANADLLDNSYEALYIWDEAADYTYGSQDYKVISNAAISGHTAIDQDFIAPGQAFMVKVVSGGGDLAFNTNMQAHNTAAAYKSKETWPSVELTITGNGNSNSTAIGFNSEMTTGLDPSFDAAKFKGNPDLALYTKLVDDNGKDFAIQALPDIDIENFVIPVGVDVAENGVFEFSAMQENLDNYSIILEDRQKNTFTNLRWDTYFATISQSGTGRFYLHFKNATAIGEIMPQNNIHIYAANNQVFIKNADDGTMTVSDVMGRIVMERNISGSEVNAIPVNLVPGVYVVMVNSGGACSTALYKTKKVFIK